MQPHHILIGLALLVAGMAICFGLGLYSLRNVTLTPDEPDAFK